MENTEWHKRALSWPQLEGQLIEDFDWPMQGYIVPYAPPLKKPGELKVGQYSKYNGKSIEVTMLVRHYDQNINWNISFENINRKPK